MAVSFRLSLTSTPRLSILLLLLSLLYSVHCQRIQNAPYLASYRVGVFEHAVIPASPDLDSREMAIQAMRRNIDVYNETVITARLNGVKLLVFPEYGIYDTYMTRQRMSLFAETIPDPKRGHRNPCKDPEFKGQSTEIQRLLSCIARDNEMFLVVNMAGRETCNHEAQCPSDGQYLYNTNVVFAPNGEIVARYYKTHLFAEDYFNSSKSIEIAMFDTPFGKFATFICFDIMFNQPSIELIERYNIRNIAYPTAWVDWTPIFRSILTHSAFARGAKVNLLAANRHWVPNRSYGSGIYTPNGAAVHYHRPNVPSSKLLVADIHQINDVKPETVEIHSNYSQETQTEEATVLDLFASSDLPLFKFEQLKTKSGSVKVCHKSFCCQASYAIKGRFQEIYALGIYEGYVLASKNKMYFQICTLLKCPSSKCGTGISDVKTVFSHISLQRTGFSSKYVFPSIVAMDKGRYELVPDAWTYSRTRGIETRPGKTVRLHSANLIGRVYSNDILLRDVPKQRNFKTEGLIKAALKYILYSVLNILYRI